MQYHIFTFLEVDWPWSLLCSVGTCGGFYPGEERRPNYLPWSGAAGVLPSAQSEKHQGECVMM